MTLPSFELVRPQSLKDACALLADPASEAIAGGTQLLFAMKNRTRTPQRLVDLEALRDLETIESDESEGLTIGARVTLARLADHPDVVKRYPAVAETARLVATPQIQSMATVAGNLCQDTCCAYVDRALEQRDALAPCLKLQGDICHVVSGSANCRANYAGDLAPVLLALGATVTVTSAAGDVVRSLGGIFTADGAHPIALGRGELIRAIHLAPPASRSGAAYLKLRQRGSLDYPLLGVAAAIAFSGETVRVRIAITGVDRAPVTIEQWPQRITDDVIERLAKAASRRVHPVKNTFAYGPSYRARAVKPFVIRAIHAAIARANGDAA